MEPTTLHKLEDISGKDLPKDLTVRHQTLLHSLDVHGFEEPPEAYDPKCWPVGRKWLVMSLVSWLCLVSPLASSIFAPATSLMNADFDNDSTTLSTFTVSFFILGYVVGSLIAAPLSEQFGRKIILDISTALFTIWELACALSPNITSLLIFRVLAGLGGSACLSIGGGIVSDLFDSKQRGLATAFFALGPLLGPIIGPIVGGFLSQAAGWRWIFWFLFILAFLSLLLQILMSRETNLRVIVARKRAFGGQQIRWWHHLDWYGPVELRHADGHNDISIKEAIIQPWKSVFTSPIIGLLCLYSGVVYGLLYLLLTTLTTVFVSIYGWSIGVSGLSYIGLGIGFMLGVVIIGSTSDRIMAKHTKRNHNVPIPEIRLNVCVFFAFLIPLSFWWYGWSAENHTFWLAPVTGLLCFGLGMIGIFLPIQTYMIDAFPENAATATAALASSRNVIGAFLPLAGPILYEDLGYGWGNTVLGFVALILIPAPYFIARSNTTFKRAANDINVLASHLGVSRIILGGHDRGGTTVYCIALWKPELIAALFVIRRPFSAPTITYADQALTIFTLGCPSLSVAILSDDVQEYIGLPQNVLCIRQVLNTIYGATLADGTLPFNSTGEGLALELADGVTENRRLVDEDELNLYVNNYAEDPFNPTLNWYRTSVLNWQDEEMILTDAEYNDKFAQPALYIGGAADPAPPPVLSQGMETHFESLSLGRWKLGHVGESLRR